MKKLIVLSGVSGAGKTTASNILEDMGYYSIDQYPVELLPNLIELLQNGNPKYENVVLTIPISDLEKYQPLLNNSEINPTLILMDADRDELINRFKFTRRIHPLLVSNVADTLGEAVDIEKNLVKQFNKKNAHIINTTGLSTKAHRQKLDKILKSNKADENLSLSFVSFGFKNGVLEDADDVFDVRFLDNPFYDPKLKKKTGKDKAVREFVMNSKTTKNYLSKLTSYLNFMFKSYSKEEKRHLTIAIGCTGGQHRSVVIAEYLYKLYKDKYVCYINHRELEKWKK